MTSFLETPRLDLIGPCERDRDRFLRMLIRLYADPRMMTHLGGPLSEDYLRGTLDRWFSHWAEHGFGPSMVRLRATGDLIAQVKLAWIELDGEKALEIGWMVLPEFQRRGVASEAIGACVAYARNKFPTVPITAFPDVGNVASNRLCEKLGLAREGLRDWEWAGRVLRSVYWRG